MERHESCEYLGRLNVSFNYTNSFAVCVRCVCVFLVIIVVVVVFGWFFDCNHKNLSKKRPKSIWNTFGCCMQKPRSIQTVVSIKLNRLCELM